MVCIFYYFLCFFVIAYLVLVLNNPPSVIGLSTRLFMALSHVISLASACQLTSDEVGIFLIKSNEFSIWSFREINSQAARVGANLYAVNPISCVGRFTDMASSPNITPSNLKWIITLFFLIHQMRLLSEIIAVCPVRFRVCGCFYLNHIFLFLVSYLEDLNSSYYPLKPYRLFSVGWLSQNIHGRIAWLQLLSGSHSLSGKGMMSVQHCGSTLSCYRVCFPIKFFNFHWLCFHCTLFLVFRM